MKWVGFLFGVGVLFNSVASYGGLMIAGPADSDSGQGAGQGPLVLRGKIVDQSAVTPEAIRALLSKQFKVDSPKTAECLSENFNRLSLKNIALGDTVTKLKVLKAFYETADRRQMYEYYSLQLEFNDQAGKKARVLDASLNTSCPAK